MYSFLSDCKPLPLSSRGSFLLKVNLIPGTPLNARCYEIQIPLSIGGDCAPALGGCALGHHIDILQLHSTLQMSALWVTPYAHSQSKAPL